jgi:hypothetical protein
MTALSENRNTTEVACNAMNIHREYIVEDGNTIYAGSIVAVNSSGKAVPASDTAGLLVAGRSESSKSAGEKVKCKSGVFILANSTGNPLADKDHLNNLCYIEDDQTAGSAGGSNNIKAGVFRGVDPDGAGIMVEIGNIRTT